MGDNQDTANNDLNLFSQVQSTHTIVNMASSVPGAAISKRRKFVADGVFFAELNEFFQRELAEEGYSGVEVRVTPTVTDIIIRATHTQEVLGEQGPRPWSLRCRPMRVPQIQAPQRSCRPQSMLWCPPIHHPFRSTSQGFHRFRHSSRPPQTRCSRYQGQDHERIRPRRKVRTTKVLARFRYYHRAKGGAERCPANVPGLRCEGCCCTGRC